MANITVPRDAKRHDPASELDDSVAGGAKLIKGAIYGLDSSGDAVNMESGVAAKARGEVLVSVDNTDGADGDKRVRGRSGQFELHILSGDEVTKADIGNTVYAYDNHTIARTSNSGARPRMGKLVRLTRGGNAVVAIGPAGELDGDLVAANNLSDVSSAATARGNLGIKGFVGGVFPLDAAGVFYIPLPIACTIIDIRSAVEGATTANGAATLTCALDTTNITNGVVTIASGAVVGEKDSATPSAANVATEGQNLRVTVAPNSQDAAAFARVTVEFTY